MNNTETLVLGFEEIGQLAQAERLALVGGKAANLGELTRAGLPVPAGFCLTTHAYALAADAAGLGEHDAGSPARERLLATEVPAEVAAEVGRAYSELAGDGPVAVRSSATAEDLPFASFAGQHDSYLEVRGLTAVVDAVRRCWASLWTDRAVSYREANGIDHDSVRLAVVVQQMVDSQVAGVLFTANPVTGRRREAVIDAARGLGELVVSGQVNPDRLVVDTESGRVLQHEPACLTDAQARSLADLGDQVERHYGSPQDIEWAIDPGGTIWLTQARAITSLYPVPDVDAEAPDGELHVYFSFSVAQGVYRPLTPMGVSAIRAIAAGVAGMFGVRVADRVAGPAAVKDLAGRIFLDATPALRNRLGRQLVVRMLGVMETRSAEILAGLFDDPQLRIRTGARPVLHHVLPMLARNAVPLRAIRALLRPGAARRRAWRFADELATVARPPYPRPPTPPASPAERLDAVERALVDRAHQVIPRIGPIAGAGFAMLGLARRLLRADLREGELATVLRGLPHNVTTEMDLALWALAGRIDADAAARQLFLQSTASELADLARDGRLPAAAQGLNGFLRIYGHRAVAEIDAGLPRWREDPAQVLTMLANYLRLGDDRLAPDHQFERARREAEEMVAELVARASRRGRMRARAARFALSRARELAGLREFLKYCLVLVLADVREQLFVVGDALVAAGRLERRQDIFFADLKEAREALSGRDLRELVRSRRADYDRELRRRHIPRVLLSDGTEPSAPSVEADGAHLLRGVPASAGTVTGKARVILDPLDAHLEPGEILVAPSTDPGWTPLFLTAGGLVMEMGGANSHGAVVAREYGIPAVVGVLGAIDAIETGRSIAVDGSAGTIAFEN
ncbi:PEP-utilizing enzyme [Flindersiella endophytica]